MLRFEIASEASVPPLLMASEDSFDLVRNYRWKMFSKMFFTKEADVLSTLASNRILVDELLRGTKHDLRPSCSTPAPGLTELGPGALSSHLVALSNASEKPLALRKRTAAVQ